MDTIKCPVLCHYAVHITNKEMIMGRFKPFAALTAMVKNKFTSMFGNIPRFSLTHKQLKRLRPKRYRPAFSMGYRGAPKTYQRIGATPAPTIDQVRDRERKYSQRIHVKNGLMFFKSDGIMWTVDEATRRFFDKEEE